MYRIPILKVMVVRDGNQTAENNTVKSPATAAEILSKYLSGYDRESFVVLLLNTKNKVIGINTVSIGTLDSSVVHPRETFKPAIVAGAAAIILCHNHPSGDLAPSQEDLKITKRLVEAGQLLGIEVLDHIIVGDGPVGYLSLKERGHI
jgi:DNA repair protein RadC